MKRFFIILGAVLSTIAIALYFSYDYWLERELKYQLSEIISKDPNSLYKYSFEKLNIDLLDGSVDLHGIKIEPRERGYDSLRSESHPVRFLLMLNLERIELKEFEILEFIRTNNIVVEALLIEQPTIAYFYNPDKAKSQQKMPLSEVFSDKFKSARINTFSINDGRFVIDNYKSPDPALSINYLDVTLTNAYMDKETIKKVAPIAYEEIKLVAGSISSDLSDDFSIVSDSLHFNAIDESFIIRDFQIRPKYSQENWAGRHNVQKQWFAITVASVSLRKIDLEHFVSTGQINVGRIRIRQPNVALYKDKRKPEPPFKKKLLPASAIASIPLKLNIDSVQIINGYVAIQETSKLTGKDSHISFYDLNGTLTNFTNLPPGERRSAFMELSASTMMYNKAFIKLGMSFELDNQFDQFIAAGTVDQVAMTTFNPVLEPMMAAKVVDGMLHKTSFEFVANDTLSRGLIDMEYNNAKIEILSTDTAATKRKKGFLSLAANTIIKSNNNANKAGYIQGIINTERVFNKDIWPYLWHSVQSGIISTLAPITNDKEAKQQQKTHRKQLEEERKESMN